MCFNCRNIYNNFVTCNFYFQNESKSIQFISIEIEKETNGFSIASLAATVRIGNFICTAVLRKGHTRWRSPFGEANNFVMRCARRQMGYHFRNMDRNLIHSRFCPVQTIRLPNDDGFFTCARFMPGDQRIVVGDYSGEVRMYNMHTGNEETVFQAHDSYILHMEPSRRDDLLLTSSTWGRPLSALWSVKDYEMKFPLGDEDYVEFSKVLQDKILGTKGETATVGWSDAVPQGLCAVCKEDLQRTLKFRILCEQSAGKIKNKYWLSDEEQGKPPEETAMSCPTLEVPTTSGTVPSCTVPEASTASNFIPSGPWDYDFTRDNFEMTHSNMKPRLKEIPCEMCNKQFKKRSKLLDHMQKVHRVMSKRSMYQCQKCGVVCNEQMALDKHFNETHLTKPFQCELCQKRFRKPFQLAQHNTQLHGQVLGVQNNIYNWR